MNEPSITRQQVAKIKAVLPEIGHRDFTANEMATKIGARRYSLYHALARLEKTGVIDRKERGIWRERYQHLILPSGLVITFPVMALPLILECSEALTALDEIYAQIVSEVDNSRRAPLGGGATS